MFARNLNVFIACLLGLSSFAAWILMIPLSMALRPVLGDQHAGMVALPLTYVLFALALAGWWYKGGLSPTHRKPGSEVRFNAGHLLLALGNVLAIAAIASPFLLIYARDWHAPALAGLMLPLVPLGLIAVVAGLLMVWSTRARDEAAPPARARLAVALPVIVGLLASGFLVFLAIVFAGAAAGNSGSGSSFMNVAVPVAVAGYAVYLAGAAWLVNKRHDKTALGLAWAPVLLLVVAAPLVQMLAVALGALLGR